MLMVSFSDGLYSKLSTVIFVKIELRWVLHLKTATFYYQGDYKSSTGMNRFESNEGWTRTTQEFRLTHLVIDIL